MAGDRLQYENSGRELGLEFLPCSVERRNENKKGKLYKDKDRIWKEKW